MGNADAGAGCGSKRIEALLEGRPEDVGVGGGGENERGGDADSGRRALRGIPLEMDVGVLDSRGGAGQVPDGAGSGGRAGGAGGLEERVEGREAGVGGGKGHEGRGGEWGAGGAGSGGCRGGDGGGGGGRGGGGGGGGDVEEVGDAASVAVRVGGGGGEKGKAVCAVIACCNGAHLGSERWLAGAGSWRGPAVKSAGGEVRAA